MASRSTSATIAAGKAARPLTPTPMSHKGARRSCALTRSAQASGVLRAPSGFRVTPLAAGSKKAEELPPLKQTLSPASAATTTAANGEVLELDEMWSFVYRRSNKRWIWLALCRRTRQVVAYASATVAKRAAAYYGSASGSASRKAIVEGYSTATSGRATRKSCPKISTGR